MKPENTANVKIAFAVFLS
ncbi:hypothetical protein RO1_03670 [Roseburia intestinalis XB6B4]|uniref:Uncharacterized protein n=1 Tax=Roseburia intestinalis XB6B4 TaxID=718255 RepID=D4KUV5_9FIRM|nr:hypothetical protein RO1_03670 [Roseburia intestinalis XB6B4]